MSDDEILELMWGAASVGDVRSVALARRALGRDDVWIVEHTVRLRGWGNVGERSYRYMVTNHEDGILGTMSRDESRAEIEALAKSGRVSPCPAPPAEPISDDDSFLSDEDSGPPSKPPESEE